jgi:hypothetical protein
MARVRRGDAVLERGLVRRCGGREGRCSAHMTLRHDAAPVPVLLQPALHPRRTICARQDD